MSTLWEPLLVVRPKLEMELVSAEKRLHSEGNTGLVTAKLGVFFCQPLALSLVTSSELEALVPFSADGKMFSNNPSD